MGARKREREWYEKLATKEHGLLDIFKASLGACDFFAKQFQSLYFKFVSVQRGTSFC